MFDDAVLCLLWLQKCNIHNALCCNNCSALLYAYIQIFEECYFLDFRANWSFVKFSSSKFYWHSFGLHQLESKIHLTATSACKDDGMH